MQQIKRRLLILFWLVILTGCWDRNEISDLNFIMGMAVDKIDKEKLRVTFQWALPEQFSSEGSQSGTSQENTSFSIEAESLGQAMAKLTEISPRTPIYSHMEVIVIGEEIGNQGIEDVINTIDREFEIRRTVNIITAKGKAEGLLRSNTPFESVSASGINNILHLTNRSSTYRPVNLNELFVHQSDPDVLAFMPLADMVMDTSLNKSEESGQNTWVRVNKMAFYDQYKLKTVLDEEETKAWMYLTGKIKKRTIMEIPTDKGKLVTSSTLQTSSSTIHMNGSTPVVRYQIEEEVSIMDKTTKMTMAEMEKAIASHIKKITTDTISKMQEDNLDVFFLRRSIREQFPQKWEPIKKSWTEIYPEMDIEVMVNVSILHENALRKEVPNHRPDS